MAERISSTGNVAGAVERALNEMIAEIAANLDATGTTASGRTRDSLEVRMTTYGGQILGRPYFQGVEKGRPAGPVPHGFHGIIKQWIVDKGLTVPQVPYKTERPHRYSVQERSLNIFAGQISHTIKEHGTRLYRNGGREDIYTQVLNERLGELMQEVSNIVTTDIRNFNTTINGRH